MSPCTVAQLAADPALRLRVLVNERNLDRLVRGVHVTDLQHPARYLLSGELVLTNGLWMGSTEPHDWVQEVRAAGASGIGYGVGKDSAETPPALVQACRAQTLALLQVPEDLSFSAIGEYVVAHNRTPDSTVRLQLIRLRRLLQELARGDGPGAVAELLRRETRLAVWLVGPGGRSLTDEELPDAGAARAAARAARRGDLPQALTARLSAFGVADALSSTAVIVAQPLAEVSDDARLVIEEATAYLVLEDARRREHEHVRSKLAEELLVLLWDGELGERALTLRLQALELPRDGEITVLASSNSRRDVTYAAMGCPVSCVSAAHRGAFVLLVGSDDDAVVDEIADLIRDGGTDPVLGTGRASAGAGGLRRALAEAMGAHELARACPEGERIVRGLEVGTHQQLLGFLDPEVTRAFRRSVIGAIERWDEEHNSRLLETLTVFFANNGHWRRTAAELHIHHNTLHYRLDKVALLTGRSVDSAMSRVDFALALAVPRPRGSGPDAHAEP